MVKTGIIICSRKNSNRIYQKPFQKINGVPLIKHLTTRCMATGFETAVVMPIQEYDDYDFLDCTKLGVAEFDNDPMRRMQYAAHKLGYDTIIRVCHDKVFIDPREVRTALSSFKAQRLDYLYSSRFVEGAGFEIISRNILDRAVEKFNQPVEHISYAVRAVADSISDYYPYIISDTRLLVDYPEDLTKLELVLSELGNGCTLENALRYCHQNWWINEVNQLPKVTVYTCAYNSSKYIKQTIKSVLTQNNKDFEYILLDDHSVDSTFKAMHYFTRGYNTKIVRNSENIGLSSSCNKILSMARGKYIVRIDADDWFHGPNSLEHLVKSIEKTGKDIVYPNYIRDGQEYTGDKHHAGGAVFKARALNHLKFTDKLRGHDSLDIFLRAKDQLEIGYLEVPIFHYRDTPNSMSKTNLHERNKIKEDLYAKHC